MKIYTKTGDQGDTGLYGGGRVRKDDARIEAYGTVDELNAVLGVCRAAGLPPEIERLLTRIQNELFDVGAELATRDPAAMGTVAVSPRRIAALEAAIDQHEETLAPLKTFILPGGTPGAAALHHARTVCRRAERRVTTLAARPDEGLSPAIVIYLNRLSDLLFVLARAANAAVGVPDVKWERT
jgi:cob(I)alamin adenosyltransferase